MKFDRDLIKGIYMNQDGFTYKTQQVSGFFSTFLLFLLIGFIIASIGSAGGLAEKGWLLPLYYVTEFICIMALYFFFFKSREGFGKGLINSSVVVISIITLLIIQFILPTAIGMKTQEPWVVQQLQLPTAALLVNLFLLVFIVPIYEEIIFRGCLFNALMYWFNDKVHWTAITLSIIFSLSHTQYFDWRAYVLLFAISLILTYARAKTKGIYLPIALHMLMNAMVALFSYFSLVN
jgi:membrane protease YdiL (CAAX protease family)